MYIQTSNLHVLPLLESAIDLKNEALIRKKRFSDETRTFTADIYLPYGCKILRIEDETIIELVSKFRSDTFNELYESFLWLKLHFSIKHFIVICNDDLNISKRISVNFFQTLEKKNEGFEIFMWKDFLRITTKSTKRKTVEIVEKKVNEVEDVHNSEKTNEEKKNDSLIEKANELFHTGKNTLFLGAGVGCEIGLPSWDELLKRLLKRANQKNKSNYNYGKIKEQCNQSSLIIARFIQELFNDDKAFTKAFKNSLYRLPKEAIIDNIKNSDLYTKIINMVMSGRVSSIITFNYDDSVERALKMIDYMEHEKRLRITSVFDAKHYLIDFPVYHVHGIIPIEDNIEPTFVLSEKEYHKLYKESYDWSNAVQLQALHDTTCFFIGLSLNDPNLRRLLEISKTNTLNDNDELHHFAILEKKGVAKNNHNKTDNEYIRTQERIFNSLGINVIWYNEKDYSKLPEILGRIKDMKSYMEKFS